MYFATLYQIVAVLIIFQINKIYSSGKFYITNNTQYYIEADQEYTWFDSLSECFKVNMTFASIETRAKSEEINALVKSNFGKNVILWVGGILTHYPNSRNYIWITTGQPFSYTYWKLNNPDFSLNNEYCIQIGVNANMEWNDNVCETKYGFICEQRQHHQIVKANGEKTAQEIDKKLQEFQQLKKENEHLEKNLSIEIKERQYLQQELEKQKDLVEHYKEQLQQNKKESKEKIKELAKENLQIKFDEKLQNETQNLLQILRKQQEWQQRIIEKLEQKEIKEKQQVAEENKKYRDLIFQANQNTYFLPNAQLTFNGSH